MQKKREEKKSHGSSAGICLAGKTVCCVLCALILNSCASLRGGGPGLSRNDKIRVALALNATSVKIAAVGPYRLRAFSSEAVLEEGRNGMWDAVAGDKKVVFGRNSDWEGIRVETARCQVNDKTYRGMLEVRFEEGKLMVINILPIEEYLYSVVPAEVPKDWPREAIYAQIVTSRTYAYYKCVYNVKKPYDVVPSVLDQVYRGFEREDPQCNDLVNSSRGWILWFGDNVAMTPFHSCCGGSTEWSANVWSTDLLYLVSVKCPYCKNSKNFTWTAVVPADKISAALGLSKLDNLSVQENFPSGRVKTLLVQSGENITRISGCEFRMKIGADAVKSTLFEVKKEGDNFIFDGHGWGHGVGMCQEGAMEMANQGKKCRAILQFYYPGTELRRLR